jgi:transcriptional regulator with XRE-family HTH domain
MGMTDSLGSINDGFVRAIHAERASRHMSQAELARRYGTYPATLSGWIGPDPAKRTVMTTEIVHRIAVILGVDVAYLARQAMLRRNEGDGLMDAHLDGPPSP